jgi:hypothetical protein
MAFSLKWSTVALFFLHFFKKKVNIPPRLPYLFIHSGVVNSIDLPAFHGTNFDMAWNKARVPATYFSFFSGEMFSLRMRPSVVQVS